MPGLYGKARMWSSTSLQCTITSITRRTTARSLDYLGYPSTECGNQGSGFLRGTRAIRAIAPCSEDNYAT